MIVVNKKIQKLRIKKEKCKEDGKPGKGKMVEEKMENVNKNIGINMISMY